MSTELALLAPPAATNRLAPHQQFAAAQFEQPVVGAQRVHRGAVVRILVILSLGEAQVMNLVSGQTYTASLAELSAVSPLPSDDVRGAERALVVINDQVDPTGTQHAKISRWVRRLTRQGGPIPNSRIKKVATHLKMCNTRLRKIIRRYRESGQIILACKPGRIKGNKYLEPGVDPAIDAAIQATYEKNRACTVSDVLAKLEGMKGSWKMPSRNTVINRLSRLRPVEVAQSIGDSDLIKATRLIKGRFNVAAALDCVQIDFTIADLMIVDEKWRRPIGRPLLGLAVDMATRMVVGAWLFLEPANRFTAGWMVAQSVMPKSETLARLGLSELKWPCYGRPQKIFVDNGFRIAEFVDACRRRGIDVAFRDPGETQQGGLIERAIGTFVRRLHMLHGTTYNNPIVRRQTKVDPEGRACYTLREALAFLFAEIHAYHHTPHGGLNERCPMDLWNAAFASGGTVSPPALPTDLSTFFIPFLWRKEPKVHREGIEIGTHWYRSEALRPYVGMRFNTYFNKSSPLVVYPEVEPDRFLRIPLEEGASLVGSSWTDQWMRWHSRPMHAESKHRQERATARAIQAGIEQRALQATIDARSQPGTDDAMPALSYAPRLLPQAGSRVIHVERLED